MATKAARAVLPDKDALWTAIAAVLEPLFTFPDQAMHTDLPRSVTIAGYSAVYTAVFNWAQTNNTSHPYISPVLEIHPLFDRLLEERCQILYLQLESTMTSNHLVHAYNQLYRNYIQRTLLSVRMLGRLDLLLGNMRSQGHGWLPCPHPEVYIPPGRRYKTEHGWSQEAVPDSPEARPRSEWFEKIDDHERQALVSTWEMPEDAPVDSEEWISAVLRAEAGQDPTEVVCIHVYALTLRRWRLNVLEPLLRGPLSHKRLAELGSDETTDVPAIGSLLMSTKNVGLKRDNEDRERLHEIFNRVSSGLAQHV
jgi:hypothetical protein